MEHTIFDLGDQYSKDCDYEEFDSKPEDLIVTSDPDASFTAEFRSGYIFRKLIDFLSDTNVNGNLIITSDNITYTRSDGPARLLNDFIIYTHELTKFEFFSKTDKIIVGFKTIDFKRKLKSIRKKSGVTLYKEPGDDFLCIQITGQANAGSSGNVTMIDQEHVGLVIHDLPEYSNPENKPNCTINADLFSEHCALMKDVSAGRINISGYENGMVMFGRTNDGRIGHFSDFGMIPENLESEINQPWTDMDMSSLTAPSVMPKFIIEEDIPVAYKAIHSITVDVATVKALGGLNSITPGGTIKVYFERYKPVKFVCHIGTFGKLTVIMKGITDPS